MRLIALMTFLAILSCGTSTVDDKQKQKPFVAKKDADTIKKMVAVIEETPKIDTLITTNYLMGKFDPKKDERFVKLSTTYASNVNMLVRKETYEAFKAMYEAAKKEGIKLKIISATRPFYHQKRIWEAKWKGTRKVEGKDLSKTHPKPKDRALKILEFSSMPGSSRHHWGTDIDINALTNEYFEKGKGLKEYEWLVANASTFGFCQTYTPKDAKRPNGYNEEKWHWSYLPVAQQLTTQYKLRIKNEDIQGFAGAEAAPQIDIVKNYVLGINQDCL